MQECSNSMKVLVTGASGFVGGALVSTLRQHGCDVTAVARKSTDLDKVVALGDFTDKTDWSTVLKDQHCVIHAAARAHVMKERDSDPLALFRKVNVEVTLRLAQQAIDAGVKRFIFISTIKVNGEQTQTGQAFRATDEPHPQDPYGFSKLEAEQVLANVCAQSSMELVIIRPPLVYGPGVKGNFASLVKLVRLGLPLPFGGIQNKRSLVARDNLISLIETCIHHQQAANHIFVVSDGDDLSTSELICALANAQGKSVRLLPCPTSLFTLVARLLGKPSVTERLFGNLQVDMSQTQAQLDWKPPVSVKAAIHACVKYSKGTQW